MKFNCSINCKCKNTNFSKIFSYNKRPNNEKKFSISGKYKRYFYACNKCEHMYAKHDFKINKLYSKQYLELTYKNERGIHKRFKHVVNLPFNKSDNKNRAKRVDKFFKKNKKLRLLDIGSGIGVFLYEMKKRNWNVSGIEMDKRYSDYCKKFHDFQVYQKKLSKFYSAKKFDLISFNKILEHVNHPHKLLKLSKKFLKKTGIVYIEVPDIYAKTKGKFRNEFCLDHLHVFSISSLDNLIKNSGFYPIKIMRIHEPSGKYTIFSFLQKTKMDNF